MSWLVDWLIDWLIIWAVSHRSEPKRFYISGRAGEAGKAYTLITDKDKEFAPHLVRNLEGANQYVPEKLMTLAGGCNWFKKNRFQTGTKGKALFLDTRQTLALFQL